MAMTKTALLMVVLSLSGCSRSFDSEPLGIQFTPPKGFDFQKLEDGPPLRAVFDNGLSITLAVQHQLLDARVTRVSRLRPSVPVPARRPVRLTDRDLPWGRPPLTTFHAAGPIGPAAFHIRQPGHRSGLTAGRRAE